MKQKNTYEEKLLFFIIATHIVYNILKSVLEIFLLSELAYILPPAPGESVHYT